MEMLSALLALCEGNPLIINILISHALINVHSSNDVEHFPANAILVVLINYFSYCLSGQSAFGQTWLPSSTYLEWCTWICWVHIMGGSGWCWSVISKERERDIKFIGLFENRGHRGPYSPYKPFNHNLYIGMIIFPHIDNPHYTGYD